MPLKFFWIPAVNSGPAEQEVNSFLSAHRVLEVTKAFASGRDEPAGWSLWVHWIPSAAAAVSSPNVRGEKVDYRDVLDVATFTIFAALRTWRKDAASAAGVPVYAVATNEQLAEVARSRCRTRAALERIEGFGPARMEKYGVALLAVCDREMTAPPDADPPAR